MINVDFITSWQQALLLYFTLCAVIPTILLCVALYFVYRRGSEFVNNVILPDESRLDAEYQRMREKYPNASTDDLVRRFVRRQSLRCGFIGGVLGIPGLPTLPITLPLDMIASYRIQASMVNFIADAYNHQPAPGERNMVTQLVMFGNTQLTQTTTRAASKAVTNVLTDVGGRFVAKLVPLAGAIIGFLVNYLTTQATGRTAVKVYRMMSPDDVPPPPTDLPT